jgi:hypothetical protein
MRKVVSYAGFRGMNLEPFFDAGRWTWIWLARNGSGKLNSIGKGFLHGRTSFR